MTLQINGNDITEAIEIASIVGSIVAMLIIGLLVYLMVRPSRKVAQAPPPAEIDEVTAAEMLRLMDRMESRLEVLERAVTVEDSRRLGPAGPEEDSALAATPRPRSRVRHDSEFQGRKA